MNECDLAYIAGLIDGEGYIGVKRDRGYKCQDRVTPGFHARIQIRMVDEAAIKFLAETLGGWYFAEKQPYPGRRPLFCYQASDAKAEMILRTILPYLRVKRVAAENVLALRDLQKDGWKHRTKVTGERDFPDRFGAIRRVANKSFSDEYVAQCEALCERSRQINRVGIP